MSREDAHQIHKALEEAVPRFQKKLEEFLYTSLPQNDFNYMVMYRALQLTAQKVSPFAAELTKKVLAIAERDHLISVKTLEKR